ncbi:MAG: ABC transporter permease [Deltaproteobacteria bacterium]|nr:ABC transporter permease [Deltaproteobacteria bacterium]
MTAQKTHFKAGRARRLKALIIKESLQVVRDPSSILIAFVLPLILLFLFGYGVSLDARQVRLGVVLEDTSPEARRLAAAFQATPFFDVRTALARRALEPDLVSGRLRGMVIIPQNFTRDLLTPGVTARIQVVTDGSETNTANYVANYAEGTLATWLIQEARLAGRDIAPAVNLVARFFYNSELDSRNSLVPGSLAIIMAIIGTLLTALVVAREWERGTMEALLATPLSALEIVFGKLVPYFVLGMASMAVCTAVAFFLYGIPFRGSLPALAIASAAFLLAALGQGFLISTVTRNQFLASQAALVSAFLPAFILSGFVFEIASMPWIIRQLAQIIPARYFVTDLQTLFLTGDVWSLMGPNVLILIGLAGLLFALTLKKTPNRLE